MKCCDRSGATTSGRWITSIEMTSDEDGQGRREGGGEQHNRQNRANTIVCEVRSGEDEVDKAGSRRKDGEPWWVMGKGSDDARRSENYRR